MKKITFLLISFLIILISADALAQQNYYVDGYNGNDDSPEGAEARPFKTLQKAAGRVRAGGTVFAKDGTYTDSNNSVVLFIDQSGYEGNYISFKNYPGHKPTIQLLANNNGGIEVNGRHHINIEGFYVIGTNDSITLEAALIERNNLNSPYAVKIGINIKQQWDNPQVRSHHVNVRQCNVTKCALGGIGSF